MTASGPEIPAVVAIAADSSTEHFNTLFAIALIGVPGGWSLPSPKKLPPVIFESTMPEKRGLRVVANLIRLQPGQSSDGTAHFLERPPAPAGGRILRGRQPGLGGVEVATA